VRRRRRCIECRREQASAALLFDAVPLLLLLPFHVALLGVPPQDTGGQVIRVSSSRRLPAVFGRTLALLRRAARCAGLHQGAPQT
jgi:hypothetical protein